MPVKLPNRKTISRWVIALACSVVMVGAALAAQVAGAGPWVANLATIIPGAVLAVCREDAWRKLHRWGVILLLAHIVHPVFLPVFLVAAMTWAQGRTSAQHTRSRTPAHLLKRHPTPDAKRKAER